MAQRVSVCENKIIVKKVVFLLCVVFLSGGVFAISGVSPGSYEVNFEPGLSEVLSFEFNFDEGVEAEIYVEGDLAEYVRVDRERIFGKDSVSVFLDLPEEIESPGLHKIRIGARQVVGSDSGIGLAADARGVINVNVPYLGKWIDLVLEVSDSNVDEVVEMNLIVFNKGTEYVSFSPIIQIFKNGTKVEDLLFNEVELDPFVAKQSGRKFDAVGYAPGEYAVVALGDYGEERIARADASFRLGELRVELLNYTREFSGEGIERFEFELESFYNDDVDVYVEVVVDDFDEVGFVTPVSELKAWENKTVEGFFDVSGIREEVVGAEIILHYGEETVSERVELHIEQGSSYVFWSFLILIFVILLSGVWRAFIGKRK